MSVKYMVLGGLMENSAHGYDLKTKYMKRVFSDFGVSDGQLYPLLKRLEKEGLIRKEVVIQEGTPNKHIYSITDEGRKDFISWLQGGEGEERSFRYEFMIRDGFLGKCTYFGMLGREGAEKKIDEQISLVEKTIEDFKHARGVMEKKGMDSFRLMIIDYGIENQKARLKWLRKFRAEIEKGKLFAETGGANKSAKKKRRKKG